MVDEVQCIELRKIMQGTRICYACDMGNFLMHQRSFAFRISMTVSHLVSEREKILSSEVLSKSEFRTPTPAANSSVPSIFILSGVYSHILVNNQHCVRRSVSPSLRLGCENASTRPRRSQPLYHSARIIASLSLHTARPDFGDPIPAGAIFVTFITWDRQAHEPRHPCRRLPAFPQRRLDVVWRGVILRGVICAVLGELGQEVDTEKGWAGKGKIAKDEFAETEAESDNVVVDCRRVGVPIFIPC